MTTILWTCAWLSGIFIGSLAAPISFALLVFATAVLAFLLFWRKCSLLAACLCPVFFVLAIIRYDAATARDPSVLATLTQQGVIGLRGEVVSEPDERERHTNLVLAVHEVSAASEWQVVSPEARVLVQVPRFPLYSSGELLEVRSRLEEPRNPAGFDYRAYLGRQGIYYQMRYPRVTSRGSRATTDPLAALRGLKHAISRGLEMSLPEPQASLAIGILLGGSTTMPPELRAAFATTNTSHILAISGWNITLVAGFLRLLGRRFLRRGLLILLVVAGVIFYTLLIGPQPSVLRAAIMGCLLLLGEYFGRPGDMVVALLIAAAAMTAFDPLYLWDVGFQLSFAATAGIALLVPRLQLLFRRLPPWLADSVSVTLAAQLATTPIMGVVFGQFSSVTTLANLLVEPVLLPIMLLATAEAVLAQLWLPLAQFIGFASWVFLTYMIRVVESLAAVPGAAISFTAVAPLLALPFYGLVFLLFAGSIASNRVRTTSAPLSTSKRTVVIVCTLFLTALLSAAALLGLPDRRLRVTFLDVGQGDAILVETPQGHRVLVDGGPSPPIMLGALGRRMPFWDRSIDLVVLTHPNEDHLSGLIDVADRMEVRGVLEPPTLFQSAAFSHWHQLIAEKRIPRAEAFGGEVVAIEPGVELQVLHPLMQEVPVADANASSLVLRLLAGDVSLLLTGDVDAQSQRDLLASGLDLSSSILKVPHHGARNALEPSFFKAVNPALAVISVGKDNTFGHPAPETLMQLADITTLRTDLDGPVEILIADGKFAVNVSP